LRQVALFDITPSLCRLLVAHQSGDFFCRRIQCGLRTAEILQQNQEAFCTDIGCESKLQPREAFRFVHCPYPVLYFSRPAYIGGLRVYLFLVSGLIFFQTAYFTEIHL